ncbi:hypothetical protein QBC41DRAFT_392351 [Cercophora samala]|uniref:Protein kinase domain-containing protein n=1 Tax=Cercophora samala TaxID=330535 RepID=A0AA39ZE59_9PEZI|nr:hypothetical protein QBC41DRAFT_392351 [Cercophora samala]
MANPRLDMTKEVLFYLVPQDAESRKMVEENPSYQGRYKGIVSLQVKAGNESKFAGRVLSIGRLKQLSDIVLYLRGLPDQQCSFQLYPSGELMLQDATTGCHTGIRCADSRGNTIDKYRLQGDPRRRIIPMDRSLPIIIWLTSLISFKFVWGDAVLKNIDEARKSLAAIAEAKRKAGGTHFETQRTLNPAMVKIEPKSPNAPVVPVDLDKKPLRQIHTYKVLGEGGFGKVSMAVDLASGELYAVKECKKRTKKTDFKDSWGTLVYLGPEATRDGIMTRATDVYALGLMLLEVLGRYCPDEGSVTHTTAAVWRKKLETNAKLASLREKCKKYQDRPPLRNLFLPNFEARHGRVQSLSDFKLLRPSVEDILHEDLRKRSTAAKARLDLLRDYEPKMLPRDGKAVKNKR